MRTRARDLAALAAAALAVSCGAIVDLEEVPYVETAAVPDGQDAGDGAPPPMVPPVDAARTDAPAGDASDCAVRSDGRLYCTNRANTPLRALPTASADVVNTLRTTSSYFLCWGTGERHAGANTTWYYTIGDDNPNLGWAPAVLLNTPDALDADPGAYGLRNCSQ